MHPLKQTAINVVGWVSAGRQIFTYMVGELTVSFPKHEEHVENVLRFRQYFGILMYYNIH